MNGKNKYELDFLAASVRIYHDVVNPIINLPFGNVFFTTHLWKVIGDCVNCIELLIDQRLVFGTW